MFLCPRLQFWMGALALLLLSGFCSMRAVAQEIVYNVNYVCNGQRLTVDSCEIRDLSANGHCFVGHPDQVKDGQMAYSDMTRGELMKLLPTCTQPAADDVRKEKEYEARLQARRDADQKKNDELMHPADSGATDAQGRHLSPAERETQRCVTSGRVMATCAGNTLKGAWNEFVGQSMPGIVAKVAPGPEVHGTYVGADRWTIEFSGKTASLTCDGLAIDPYPYHLDLQGGHATITIATAPRPTVLTLRADTRLSGAGPLTIDGRVITGYTNGGSSSSAGHYESSQTTSHQELTPLEATQYAGQSGLTQNGGMYDMASTSSQSSWVPGGQASAPMPIFGPKRVTCPAPALEISNGGATSTDAATGLLTSFFNNGDSGPPTPPGIRMHGIFASSTTGFSAEFFPESVILGCGPDAAHAYPYKVVPETGRIEIEAPDHALSLAFRPDGSLDPGSSSPYQVNGRSITGRTDDGFSFAPLNRTCNLALLSPSDSIPEKGGELAVAGAAAPMPSGPANAVLVIHSGLLPAPGQPNPLAMRPFMLLRSSIDDTLRTAGISVPPGVSSLHYFGEQCATNAPDCRPILIALTRNLASTAHADTNGDATFQPLPSGTYYLLVTAQAGNQPMAWSQPVHLNSGQTALTLDQRNTTPIN